MASRKKRSKRKGTKSTTTKRKRGRKVPPEELQLRADVFSAQEKEGFTNAEAAERAGTSLPNWNQWKAKHRKQANGAPARRGRKPVTARAAKAAPVAAAISSTDIDYAVENAQLRGRIAELEAMLEALGRVFQSFSAAR